MVPRRYGQRYLDLVDAILPPAGPGGRAWVPPDWPEGDPRWPLIEHSFRLEDRENNLRLAQLAAIEEFVFASDAAGVPHAAIAEYLDWTVERVEECLRGIEGRDWNADSPPRDIWRWRREEGG
jgi:hypothetical protein